jgi:sucrose phosphorylase
MVYNFALPPLLAHSVLSQNTKKLTQWAASLRLPSDKVCFFNFTASHDGCGLRPVSDILTEDEIDFLVNQTIEHGGLISYRDTPQGQKPYELNSSYIDILSSPDDDDILRMKRMLLSQALVLAMPGVPGIYFHSLVGSKSYHEGVKFTGIKRSINREKFNVNILEDKISKDGNIEKNIFTAYKRLISIRITEKAFNPFGKFEIIDMGNKLFVIKQISLDESELILAIHNFTNDTIALQLPTDINYDMYDLLSNVTIEKDSSFNMDSYQIMWLKKLNKEN